MTRHAMSVLLPEDLYQWLRAEAFRQHTSMSKLIAEAVTASKREQQLAPITGADLAVMNRYGVEPR